MSCCPRARAGEATDAEPWRHNFNCPKYIAWEERRPRAKSRLEIAAEVFARIDAECAEAFRRWLDVVGYEAVIVDKAPVPADVQAKLNVKSAALDELQNAARAANGMKEDVR